MRQLSAEQQEKLDKYKDSFERASLLYEPASLHAQLREFSSRITFVCKVTRESIFSIINCACEEADADTCLLLEAAGYYLITEKVGEIFNQFPQSTTMKDN